MEKAWSLIFDSDLDKYLQRDAVRTAAYLTNQTVTSVLLKTTCPEFDTNLMTALSAGNLMSNLPQTQTVSDSGWKAVIQDELILLQESCTQLLSSPEKAVIIGLKCVVRQKFISWNIVKKTRLVAQGFKQYSLEENEYAPVTKNCCNQGIVIIVY